MKLTRTSSNRNRGDIELAEGTIRLNFYNGATLADLVFYGPKHYYTLDLEEHELKFLLDNIRKRRPEWIPAPPPPPAPEAPKPAPAYECCGHKCPTPFCPHCGKRSQHGAAASLLAHLENPCRMEINRPDGAAHAHANGDAVGGRYARQLNKTAAKWEGWRDGLRALLLGDVPRLASEQERDHG